MSAFDWLPILVAASTIAAVAGVVFMASRDDDGSLVVTTEPAQPEPGSNEPAVVDPDAGTDTDASQPPPATDPPITEPAPPRPAGPFSFDVPDQIGEPLPRTVLLTVDAVNSRWWVVGQGASRNIPFPDGEVVVGSPVIGPDGLLYAPVAAELRHTSPRRVVAFDPLSFEEVASYPVGPSIYDRLELVNGALQLGAAEDRYFDVPLGTPTVAIDYNTRLVTISLSGTQREFRFPENWLINGRDVAPINDGSVVVRASATGDTDEWDLVLVRLFLDGTTAVGIVNNGSTTNGAPQITSDGFVQLEGPSVVRYDLPDFAGTDPLAG